MSTSLTVALLAVLTTVGLVGSVVSDGAASLVWAVTTVAVAGLLAWRLRSAPPGMGLVAAFVTGILVVSAGLPVAIVMTEDAGGSGSRGAAKPAGVAPGSASPVADPSTELRRAVAKAGELPGGAESILSIDIDENTTRVTTLDLTTGQRVSAYFSHSSDTWYEPSRSSTNDRADAAFKASDIAGLDLTATATKVTAAADTIGIDRTSPHASDGIEIERRSGDKKLVATFSMSGVDIETDGAGALPDNLALAKVDGLLPTAERLLRTNGLDPAQPVIDELQYRVFASNAGSVGSGRGTVEMRINGAGRSGTLKETVGKFPEVSLTPSRSASSSAFALRVITSAGIERARADLEKRFTVLPIDAHALGLEIDEDSRARSSSRAAPPVMEVGLGPGSRSSAYYALDGTYLRAD
ncbi:hypothetical protein [Tsukamurella pseudospumae]|uniref:Uncharacterized protein n=1 Tax=Tsukamurella pseudospumae TaxID=239498 RepID=A0A137ZDL1_9ACTN|nr:hypothetical protein [Tsukamurella pseudospumae]KXO96278.1 hypothetical protein AXK61_22435 [Tsukamurella pseudospumae]